jgi:hypothetical protein
MEKALGNVMGVVFVVGEFVMPTMISTPDQGRALERRRAKQKSEKLYWPLRLEGQVGKQAVIAQCNAEPRCSYQEQEEANLKAIHPIAPDVGGDADDRRQKRPDKERAISPVDFFPRNVHLAIIIWPDAMKRPAIAKFACVRTKGLSLISHRRRNNNEPLHREPLDPLSDKTLDRGKFF